MTPKRVQMIHFTSKYFGTNYWSLNICLKFWDFQGENDKVFVISEKKVTEKSTPPMTDKMMSDQVYILISDVSILEPVVWW